MFEGNLNIYILHKQIEINSITKDDEAFSKSCMDHTGGQYSDLNHFDKIISCR